jgi:YD repeat-containing protein
VTVKDPQNSDIDAAYTFDGLGRAIRADYQLGYFETFVYDGAGNVVETTDRRGITVRNTFDNLGRPLTRSVREDLTNGGQWLTLMAQAYDDGARTVNETDANGNRTRTEYDELGRIKAITDALGERIVWGYDGVNKVSEIDRNGNVTRFVYDDINRRIRTEEYGPASATPLTVITADYQDAQNRVVETDRSGIVTVRQNDSRGRLVQLSRDVVTLQRHEYDGNDNKILFTDAEENRTRYAYDGADRMTVTTEGDGVVGVEASTTYTYDNVGNVLTVKDGRNHGGAFDVSNVYDARYRKVTVTNGAGDPTTSNYDGNDNLLSVAEPRGAEFVTFYTYDELNTLLSVDDTRGGLGGVTRYFYDGNRNKIAQQDANGNLTTYRYDALDRLTDTFQHFAPGGIAAGTARGLDPRGSMFYAAAGDEATALHWRYGYDDGGNQTLIVDALGQRVE